MTAEHRALLSKSAAARLLGVCPETVDAMIRAGQIESRHIAGLQRPKITMYSVERFLTRPPESKTRDELLREYRKGV